MRSTDRLALAIGGALAAWFVLGQRGTPGDRAPAPSGPLGYQGELYALPPEPLATEPHDVWELSPDAQRAVDSAGSIPYVGGGAWDASRCATSRTAHAADLAALIRSQFAWVRTIGGLRCEALHTWHGDELSIHAAGRALDVMTPVPPQVYGGTQGEQLANWLVANATALGVQLVIWNRRSWQGSLAPASRFAAYNGRTVSTEHRNHVHVEVNS
jgi:hypothetical protein